MLSRVSVRQQLYPLLTLLPLGVLGSAVLFDYSTQTGGVRLFSVDPGEMNTRMHADAIPDADPATLADPADVAARIVKLIANPLAAPTGVRRAA